MVSRGEDAAQQQESVTFSPWEGGRKNAKYKYTIGGSKLACWKLYQAKRMYNTVYIQRDIFVPKWYDAKKMIKKLFYVETNLITVKSHMGLNF